MSPKPKYMRHARYLINRLLFDAIFAFRLSMASEFFRSMGSSKLSDNDPNLLAGPYALGSRRWAAMVRFMLLETMSTQDAYAMRWGSGLQGADGPGWVLVSVRARSLPPLVAGARSRRTNTPSTLGERRGRPESIHGSDPIHFKTEICSAQGGSAMSA